MRYNNLVMSCKGGKRVKTGIKRSALLLAAVMLLLCLTGCGAFETKMARAWQKLDKVDSLRLKVADDLIVDVTAGGMKLPVAISLSGTVDLYLDPVQAKADLTVSWPSTELKLLVYLEEKGEAVNVYTNLNGGEIWEKASYTASKPRLSPNGLKYIIEGAETFREVEQPGVTDGSRRYDGQLPGSFLQGFLKLYDAEERIERDFGLDVPDDLFTNLNSVPTSLWLNRQGELDLIVLEPTALLNGLLPKLLADFRAASGLSQLPLEHTVESNQIILQLGEFDALPMLEIPEEALAAWGDGAMDWE